MRVKSRSSISLSWADFLSVSRVPPANSISAVCVAASNLAARVVAERVCFTPTPATVGTGSQNRFDWHAEAIHIIDKPRQGRSYRRQKPLLARTKSLRNNLEIRRSVVTYAGNVFGMLPMPCRERIPVTEDTPVALVQCSGLQAVIPTQPAHPTCHSPFPGLCVYSVAPSRIPFRPATQNLRI